MNLKDAIHPTLLEIISTLHGRIYPDQNYNFDNQSFDLIIYEPIKRLIVRKLVLGKEIENGSGKSQ